MGKWISKQRNLKDFLESDVIPPLKRVKKYRSTDKSRLDLINSAAPFVLLYDIPFYYLIPCEELLTENTVRFFCLDINWIAAFLDGFTSPGRNVDIDFEHDRNFIGDVFKAIFQTSDEIREKLQYNYSGLKSSHTWNNSANMGSDNRHCTGFIMRSPIVTHFRGLEFTAKDINQKLLKPLRIENLSDDVIIAIFYGELGSIEINGPPEGLHYGFRKGDNGAFILPRRDLESGKLDYNSKDGMIDVAVNLETRVIDYAKTAINIAERSTKESLTGAETAAQFLRNSYQLHIKKTESNS